jgi:hypothetical protein
MNTSANSTDNNSSQLCPSGFRSDNLLRISMSIFNETRGLDCYLNELGYGLFAAVVIGQLLIIVFLNFFGLIRRDVVPKQRLVRAFVIVGELLKFATVICGLTNPSLVFLLWTVYDMFHIAWASFFLGLSIESRLVNLATHRDTSLSVYRILGRRRFVLCLIFIVGSVVGVAVSGLFCFAFALDDNNNEEEDNIKAAWICHCVSWCLVFSSVAPAFRLDRD